MVMSDLPRNSQCIFRILQDADSLTTSEIIDLALGKQYSDLCGGCAGGDVIIAAANQLVEMGLATKIFGKGGYRWQLVKE